MRPTVYIETTIPSYYCDDRVAHLNEIRRTREWWDWERDSYTCYISQTVLEELNAGNYPGKDYCLKLVAGLSILSVIPEILDIAEAYQARRLMPRDPAADSIHLALASYYAMDYLLTWNCRHLANATKIRHLERVDRDLGLSIPILATPHMLQIVE